VKRLSAALLVLCIASGPAWAYKILYAEQFYRLYHLHLSQYPERTAENIWYLERALGSDFANPLNALAIIKDQAEWERYRYLFRMHVNLKLIELHLQWGVKYDKLAARFFNAPWRDDNLKSLERAESLYEYARRYWDEAKNWSAKAWPLKTRIPEIQMWEDENHRIETNELDYGKIIDKHLARLRAVRAKFEAMDASTY
jgi:hypothetical protein